ncbi:WXG100-like domain-containing protein [Actinoallomurus acanthiterrae]
MVAPRRVDVSPAMVDGAAKNFAVGQHDLVDTWMRLLGGLDGNHGMAGNDKAANVFNAKYAPAVQAAWKAFRQAIVVIGGASLGLTQTANNHLAADHHSRADASGGASALLGPNEVYPDMSLAQPQSAIGPAATGPYLGANRLLATLLVGCWPAAHPNNLENAAGKWYAAANEVNKIAEWLNWSIGQLADSSKTQDFAAIQRYWHKVYQAGDGHSLLGGLIKLCNALGDACDRYANVTWATQNKINLIVSSQEVLVLLSAGSEGVITRLRGVFNRIAAAGASAVGREVGAAVTEGVVAEAVAAAAETPKIEPIAADFEATAGKAITDEIGTGSGLGPGRAIVDDGKYDYMFGRVVKGSHNAPRSAQNLAQLNRIGIHDTPEGRQVLSDFFNQQVSSDSNIVRSYSNQYGDFQIREGVLAGPGGFLKVETAWQITENGPRLTTIIPRGG